MTTSERTAAMKKTTEEPQYTKTYWDQQYEWAVQRLRELEREAANANQDTIEMSNLLALLQHMYTVLGKRVPLCPTCKDDGNVQHETGSWGRCPDCRTYALDIDLVEEGSDVGK